MMGGNVTKMHTTILPHTAQPLPPATVALTAASNLAWQQLASPANYGGIPLAGGNYRQQMIMTVPIQQPRQGMLNFVGQYSLSPRTMSIRQMGQQPTVAPMMVPYNASNQQPGYFS
jgi:hypothetical protein